MGVEVLNFGCRLNIAEGEAIRVGRAGADDLLIINSCAVTAEAERQASQAIRRAARAHPGRRIEVTGCGADISGARYAAMPEVTEVVPNVRKLPASLNYQPLISGADHARAFVSIQTGCDHDCTFCVIHIARGKSRSARIADVVAACKRVVDAGQQEVVLTGVDLTSYDDSGAPLGALVEAILTEAPDLPRLRLSSLDCIEIDPLLEELLANEPRLMPHLHLSFQSGDDLILKRMKRRHSARQGIELVQRLKRARPEIAIGADLIAGFPTEDEAMFAHTMDLIEAADIVFGHVFPFSPRPGTPAARMPQVLAPVAKERAARLRAAIDARRARWFDTLIGSTQSVLIERDGLSGHAPNFARVVLISPSRLREGLGVGVTVASDDPPPAPPARGRGECHPNTIHALRITHHDGAQLYGMPA